MDGAGGVYEADPLVMPKLLRCDAPPDRNWIHVQLQGTRPDRHGLGARVRARAGASSTYAKFNRAGGFLAGTDLRAHVGLGSYEFIDELAFLLAVGSWVKVCSIGSKQIIGVKGR
jgi:hypothetical protein